MDRGWLYSICIRVLILANCTAANFLSIRTSFPLTITCSLQRLVYLLLDEKLRRIRFRTELKTTQLGDGVSENEWWSEFNWWDVCSMHLANLKLCDIAGEWNRKLSWTSFQWRRSIVLRTPSFWRLESRFQHSRNLNYDGHFVENTKTILRSNENVPRYKNCS